jgi:hypothetical protein
VEVVVLPAVKCGVIVICQEYLFENFHNPETPLRVNGGLKSNLPSLQRKPTASSAALALGGFC